MPSPAAHRLLEKRDDMIASTQGELAAVNLRLTEVQDKLNEVNKQATKAIPRLTKELYSSKTEFA
jgi:septal ring factor EnvC (AmiA/AmiB activator)